MKVVLFCGGRGIRLREHSEAVPKPMVTIGYRPILWHVMRYYAHYGHREFILCLGYKADVIKRYFLDYEEALSNDFVLNGSDRKVELLGRDMDDWEISFVDTGLNATLAERLCAIRPHLGGDDVFLANYADVLTDAPLNDLRKWRRDRRLPVHSANELFLPHRADARRAAGRRRGGRHERRPLDQRRLFHPAP